MRLAKAGIGGYNTRTVATHPSFSEIDYAQRPFILFWELTRACALACRHCRAVTNPAPNTFCPSRTPTRYASRPSP